MFSHLKKLFSSGRVNVKQRFQVQGTCSQGSMSKVYKALDTKLDKVICLKILDKEKTAQFEARFAGLKRPSEGAICEGLSHPHIVEFYEHGLTTLDEQFLVMEWVGGPGLQTLVEKDDGQLAGQRLKHLDAVADALGYVHEQGLLHRDICPRNILITRKGSAKLIDFGLSVPYQPEFCKPGNRTGTADYLAPEIIKRMTTNHRVDLFALGVTAYQMFSGGYLPWERGESMQTLLQHVNSPPQDPRSFKADLEESVVQFLLKAVERDPARRFQSAAEFRDALKTLPKKY